jgi:hypothetical protein
MDQFIISSSNVRVPRIIYGTAWKKAATEQLVSLAIQKGFRGIDTACQPKHHDEPGVGAGVAASLKQGPTRADLYLQTKFTSLSGQDPKRIPYDPKASPADQITRPPESSPPLFKIGSMPRRTTTVTYAPSATKTKSSIRASGP